jgi:hypothetical protein
MYEMSTKIQKYICCIHRAVKAVEHINLLAILLTRQRIMENQKGNGTSYQITPSVTPSFLLGSHIEGEFSVFPLLWDFACINRSYKNVPSDVFMILCQSHSCYKSRSVEIILMKFDTGKFYCNKFTTFPCTA